LKSETIQKLVNISLQNGVEDVGEVISKTVEEEKRIKSRIQAITGVKNDYMAEVKHQIEELNKQIRETQGQCPHIEKIFYSDPSGGNDSSTFCDWCGKEL
jgi:ferritin-like metal-binding protein YciE